MKKPEAIAKEIAEAKNKSNEEAGRGTKRPLASIKWTESIDQEEAIESGKHKYSFLIDLQALPEITESDLIIAKSLISEYSKIPFEPLCWLVRDLSYTLNKYREDFNADMLSLDENYWNKLCSDDIDYKAVTFDSNKGQISIPANSIIFQHYFLPIIEKLKALHTKTNTAQAKEMEAFLNYVTFMKTWRFFDSTDLGTQQKRISAGMIFQHFNLFELKSRQDWNPEGSYGYYRQYLNDRVKQMLKSISP